MTMGEQEGDRPAIGVADQVGSLDLQGVEHPEDKPGLAVSRIAREVPWPLGGAEAEEVERDDSIGAGEGREDLAPAVGRGAEAMEEDDRLPPSLLDDVDEPAADVQEALGRQLAADLGEGF